MAVPLPQPVSDAAAAVPAPTAPAVQPCDGTLAGVAHRDGLAFAFVARAVPRRRWHPEHGLVLALWLGTLALGAWRLLG